jgi:hypothetical protein
LYYLLKWTTFEQVNESDELFSLFAFIKLHVARINRDAPLQNRLLCRMHACLPDGFQPCSSNDFTPIPAAIPSRCVGCVKGAIPAKPLRDLRVLRGNRNDPTRPPPF